MPGDRDGRPEVSGDGEATMKRVILIGVVLACSGCSTTDRPTNEEIIKQYKTCQDAGMDAEALRDSNGLVMAIQCVPPKVQK